MTGLWLKAATERLAGQCALERDLGDHHSPATLDLLERIGDAARQTSAVQAPSAGHAFRRLTPLLHDAGWGEGPDTPPLRSEFERLCRDLGHLELFEGGGLSAVNMRLAALLGNLQEQQTQTEAAAAALQLEDLLYRAIYLFPHAALGVEIDLDADALEAGGGLQPERHSEAAAGAARRVRVGQARQLTRMRAVEQAESEHGRQRIGQLARAAGCEAHAGVVTLSYALPYRFAAQSPAKQRQAAHESWNEIEVEVHPRYGPTLLLTSGLERLTMHREYGRFAFDEVRAIRFGQKTGYVPWLLESRRLEPKLNCVMHYLVFREFGDVARKGDVAGGVGAARHARLVFEPSFVSRLLEIETNDEDGRETVIRGYFAAPSDDPNQVLLYRFENFALDSVEGAAAAIHRAMREEDGEILSRAQRFWGRQVLDELARIPVEPRVYL